MEKKTSRLCEKNTFCSFFQAENLKNQNKDGQTGKKTVVVVVTTQYLPTLNFTIEHYIDVFQHILKQKHIPQNFLFLFGSKSSTALKRSKAIQRETKLPRSLWFKPGDTDWFWQNLIRI